MFARDMPAMRRFHEDVMRFPIERVLLGRDRTLFFRDPDGNLLENYAEVCPAAPLARTRTAHE